MGFYSFVAINESGDVVTIPKHFLVLDTGRNVFNTQVEDVGAFTELLKQHGVLVTTTHKLDDFDPVEAVEQLPEGDPGVDRSRGSP